MKQDLLKRFLVGLPARLDYDKPEAIKTNLFKALYYACTNDGEFLDDLFPMITDGEKLDLDDYKFPLDILYNVSFFSNQGSDTYSHPVGSACARPLRKGEPVYRCEECGFDSTCVLCIHCFNENDHIGHNVQMYIARDSTNGICDCGDPEAFKSALKCKCQMISDDTDIHSNFKSALKTTLRIILDYILDVSNFSITTLPFIHDNINKGHTPLTSETLSELSSLPANKYGSEDINSSNKWHLILWNDEYHNFPEATEAISSATGVEHLKAHEIATKISMDGRCLLKSASSPISLFKSLDAAETGGLVASIISARDYMREQMIEVMIEWIQDILNFNSNSSFREYSRKALGDLLLEPGYSFPRSLPITLIDGLSIDVKRRCYENGLTYNGAFVNGALTKLKPQFAAKDLNKSIHMVLDSSGEKLTNSRLQFLLTFSIRFKSSIRKSLSQIIIPPVLIDPQMKAIFCQQYIQIYPQLLTCLALSDREDHLSCISDISSQIMTCPTSVQYILTSGHIGNIIGPLAQLIEEHVGKWNYDTGYPTFYEHLNLEPSKMKSLYEAVLRGIHDLNYIVDSNLSAPVIYNLLEKHNLASILLLLRTFQGYWTIERKYGDHVEREILDFVVHLRYSVPILKISKHIAEAETEDIELIKSATKLLINYLNVRKIDQKAPGIANFSVSKDRVSFVHPINSLLSYLFQAHDFSIFLDILQGLNTPFMAISDISLRSIVLGAQVKIGFWIRNGISVSRQATLYSETAMADSAYWRDIHLNQVALLIDDPRTTLYNFLDRWEILDWFSGEVSHEFTIYEDRFSSIAEKFILFIYNLLCDRSSFIRLSKFERLSIISRKLISYSLSDGPKTYSNVKDGIDSEIREHANFDNWLIEVADYQPPTSLVDSGMYRLKPHIYGELDPYSLHLDSSQSQDVSDAIIKYISSSRAIKEEEVNLVPKLILSDNKFVNDHIGDFSRTIYFAKLVYKFLQVSLDTKDETYLPHLLHLIHAVLLDDETITSKNHIPESFVTIPISDLLLNIIESTMSKHLVNKATYLLDEFISKDSRVIDSLVDCFGKDHIDEYMEKKSGNLESESEKRKRLASQRTARVMKKFAKQRKKFLDNNNDLIMDKPFVDSKINKRHCVVCNEPESNEEIFGMLGSTLNTSILWKLNQEDPIMFKAGLSKYNEDFTIDPMLTSPNQEMASSNEEIALPNMENPMQKTENTTYGKGYKYSTKQTYFNNLKYDAFISSTCGHGLHYHCYRNISARSNYFSCPLCHTIQNIFIPSFLPPNEGGGLTIDQMDYEPIESKYNQILHSSSQTKSQMLINGLFNESYTESSMIKLRRNLQPFSEDLNLKLRKGDFLQGSSTPIKYFNLLQKLSTLIADTIRMQEITSRLNGTDGYTKFLQIPDTAKTLLKSLVQCRALLFELREMPPLLGSNNDLSDQIKNFWDSEYLVDGVFNEVIMLYFQTDESLTTLSRLGFTKMVTLCFYSLATRFRDNSIGVFTHLPTSLDHETIENLDKVFSYGKEALGLDYINERDKESFFIMIYYCVERCVLPFLKQLLIFTDILTSTSQGDNNHISTPELEDLEHEIKAQNRLESIDVLCKKLSIPTLKELLGSLAQQENFEYKIHDIVLRAKIPRYFDSGVLTIDYPGVIKLINLPNDFMTCLMDYNGRIKNGVYDNYICLHCGLKLPIGKFYRHMKRCSSHTCIFFHASKNSFRVVTHIGGGPLSVHIPGPYLTIHGEVKDPRSNGKATLNEFRYNDLNRSWLNQNLHGFITRSLYGRQTNEPFANFTTPNIDTSDEEEDNFYSPFVW